ncbi:hypothetical protein IIU_05592 [Bacillus cereus VD133]|uniref:Uncharacterized protein n=1 Tax=Bacillus cereus VD133 TaxID=1053233 RepID=A0A9W5PLM3_BACCE|nr:hypothetical protein [Bacillus cereus]EOO28911.1 hypothetical protein IIU_05592 [Bacillus cereus VD133]
MKLTREERIQLTYEIGDIIEQKCRRCYYNRTDDENFSVTICANCPTGRALRQLGRYFDSEPRHRGRKPENIPEGLTPACVRELNGQGIPDKKISLMFQRSPSYVGKLKNRWRKQGLWKEPNRLPKKSRNEKKAERNVSPC